MCTLYNALKTHTQYTYPQFRQWCFLTVAPNALEHWVQLATSLSSSHLRPLCSEHFICQRGQHTSEEHNNTTLLKDRTGQSILGLQSNWDHFLSSWQCIRTRVVYMSWLCKHIRKYLLYPSNCSMVQGGGSLIQDYEQVPMTALDEMHGYIKWQVFALVASLPWRRSEHLAEK